MGCFIVLFALISPRLAIIFVWLFSNILERAYDTFWLPLLGFFFLPWTTLAYALCWESGNRVEGFDWFIVGLAFLVDVASLAGGRRARRD